MNDRTASGPLVSIVIAAYTPDYLEQALASALGQTYPATEIVVVDDRPDGSIEEIVRRTAGDRVRYHRHPNNRGSVAAYRTGFSLARGTYVKYLNDDDVLAPECVRRQLEAFERFGEKITLVTSKRRRIDSSGAALPEQKATEALFRHDAYVSGRDLAAFVLRTLINFIGEPSTAMFRRVDLCSPEEDLFELNGRTYGMNVDVVMWLKLLRKGDAVYLTEELSSLRLHPRQEQLDPRNALALTVAWGEILEDARALGLLDDPSAWEEARWRCVDLFEQTLKSGRLGAAGGEKVERRLIALMAELERRGGRRPRLPRVRRMLRRVRGAPGWKPPLRHRYFESQPSDGGS